MKRIAVVGAILDAPSNTQQQFNQIISAFKGVVKGRLGIPFERDDMAVISLTVVAELDRINALTGKLGNLPGVTVKTAISDRTIKEEPA